MGSNLAQAINANFTAIVPELILTSTMLIVMIWDLYVSRENKRNLVWVTLAGVVLSMVSVWWVAGDEAISKAIAKGAPLEFFGNMVVADNYAFFLKMVLLGVVALIVLLSVDYVEKFLKGMYLEFYEVVLAATLGMLFMVGSRDLIAIYLGLELASISSYVLAGLLRKDPKSNEAALKYFLNGALASAVLLFGLSLVFGVSGTTYLPDIAKAMAVHSGQHAFMMPLLVTGVLFMAMGFAFKVAAAPMHLWAPDVYEGSPTPVTAFFSAGPKAAAFGAILRVFLVGFGAAPLTNRWVLIWAVLAAVSMFIGNLTALMQSNVKRMMAYSSIAQAGYILLGVVAAGALQTGAGTGAVLFYIMGYALTNLGIFAVLTHLDQEGGWVTVKDFNGLSERNPVYAWILLICFVSLIGIPPTVGFMGKFFLFKASLTSGYLWLALLMAVNSAISVGYYYGIVKAMFLEKPERPALPFSGGIMATAVISVVGIILLGILAGPFIGFAEGAAALLK